jgi:hypothetical protein
MWHKIDAEKIESTNTEYEKRYCREKTFRVCERTSFSRWKFSFFFRDLRAKLEVAIEKVLNSIRLTNTFSKNNHGYTDEDDDDSSSVPTSDNEEVRLQKFSFFINREFFI